MPKRQPSKRQKQFAEALATLEQPTLAKEGFEALKKVIDGVQKTKLNETIEAHIRLGVDVKHADQQVRSTVVLPEGLGKTVRVAVIAKGDKAKEALAAGADHAGFEDLVEKIDKGWFEFDVLVATPDVMAGLAKLGRVLGPKGLMPNPKTGTVTLDVGKAVKELKAGKVEFRTDKTAIIHTPIGKKNFTSEQMLKNFSALYDAVLRAKPAAAKGTYVKSLYITSTMGPSIKLDPQRVAIEIKDYLN